MEDFVSRFVADGGEGGDDPGEFRMPGFEISRELLDPGARAPEQLDVELGPEEVDEELLEHRRATVERRKKVGAVLPEVSFAFRETASGGDVVVVLVSGRQLSAEFQHERTLRLKQ